jgi:aspartyl-tRNA synthetase
MKNVKFISYQIAEPDIKKSVQFKYLRDIEKSIQVIPDEEHQRLIDVIEVIHNEEYIYVTVTSEDLRDIHWNAYLETSDDGIYLPYHDDNFQGEFLGTENDLY